MEKEKKPNWKKWAHHMNRLGIIRGLAWGKYLKKGTIDSTSANDQLRKFYFQEKRMGHERAEDVEEEEMSDDVDDEEETDENIVKWNMYRRRQDLQVSRMFLADFIEILDLIAKGESLVQKKEQLEQEAIRRMKTDNKPQEGEEILVEKNILTIATNIQRLLAVIENDYDMEKTAALGLLKKLRKALEDERSEDMKLAAALGDWTPKRLDVADTVNVSKAKKSVVADLYRRKAALQKLGDAATETDKNELAKIEESIKIWEKAKNKSTTVVMTAEQYDLWRECQRKAVQTEQAKQTEQNEQAVKRVAETEHAPDKRRKIVPELLAEGTTTDDLPGSLKDAK